MRNGEAADSRAELSDNVGDSATCYASGGMVHAAGRGRGKGDERLAVRPSLCN